MKHILFVCQGNICRSPMAEFLMKKMARTENVSEWFDIASAATSNEEEGNPVYPLARRELAQHGIGCVGKTARRLSPDDYERYDMILCMESSILDDTLAILGSDPEGKVTRLLDHTDQPRDIADPWYTRDFRAAWNDIHYGVQAIFDSLLPQAKVEIEELRAQLAESTPDDPSGDPSDVPCLTSL